MQKIIALYQNACNFLYKFFIPWFIYRMVYNVTMNRNNLEEIINIICSLTSKEEIRAFLTEIFTQNELETLSKRWRIMKMLSRGLTQRQIANELNVSLCKVTRGSKILKNKNAITTKFLKEGK